MVAVIRGGMLHPHDGRQATAPAVASRADTIMNGD